VRFEEEEEDSDKTKLINKSFFPTVEDRDIMLNLRVDGGTAESMDRLAKLLKYIGKGRYDNDEKLYCNRPRGNDYTDF
jgi:hypothetical protein